MLTILVLWVVASALLGILVGTVIRKMDEAPAPRRSAIRRRWANQIGGGDTGGRGAPSRLFKYTPSVF